LFQIDRWWGPQGIPRPKREERLEIDTVIDLPYSWDFAEWLRDEVTLMLLEEKELQNKQFWKELLPNVGDGV